MEIGRPTRRGVLQLMAALPATAAGARPKPGAGAGFPTRAELGLAPASSTSTPPRPDLVRMSYAPDPDSVRTAADRVRGKAASLVGCTPDEILLTQGTTDGITTIAHSIRLREGDHVLLTDQEHEGGETGWLHRERRDGIVVDRVNIPINPELTRGAAMSRLAEPRLPAKRRTKAEVDLRGNCTCHRNDALHMRPDPELANRSAGCYGVAIT